MHVLLQAKLGLLVGPLLFAFCAAAESEGESGWAEAMAFARSALVAGYPEGIDDKIAERARDSLGAEFPMQCDWFGQDTGDDPARWFVQRGWADVEERIIHRVLDELGTEAAPFRREYDVLSGGAVEPGDRRWLDVYERACRARRQRRLRIVLEESPRIVFTKHYNLGGSHYAYTEGLSDAQSERHFVPGSALCRLELGRGEARVRTLLASEEGVIRDPDVSWDGQRILFAWKKSDRDDDYHLYEMTVGNGEIRQVTSGVGIADYEGVYLPDGDVLFNSTRCVQTVDCWWTEVSNLYRCRPDGSFLRRLTFDQVHDNYPTVMPDGRVIYTRWEYSDRGQIFVQGLFQMNPDGTGQSEFYGNNSWFPTALLHARGIPGLQTVVATLSGHHTIQVGKLGIIDPALGRQENSGVQLIAPVRPTPAERIDAYGQEGELFQYPYPLSETEFLVAFAPRGWARDPVRFGLYLVTLDGRRELLAADSRISCNQPIPLRSRARPPARPMTVDYRQTNGIVYLQNIHAGPGLDGIAPGAVRKLRVIALEYRAAGLGCNYNSGPAGAALVCTPPAIGNGTWDVKTVLGDARVFADGSACFEVPARTPFYMQAIDEQGCAVQTMRSWTVLQPAETVSCSGCHEPKNMAPPTGERRSMALAAGPQRLEGFYGPPRGFSFLREIQPIFDRHCVRCHHDSERWRTRIERPDETAVAPAASGAGPDGDENSPVAAFSLKAVPVKEAISKRQWTESYLALTHARVRSLEDNAHLSGEPNELLNWVSAQSVPEMLPPYSAGAAKSRFLTMLKNGHRQVKLSTEELDKLACWIDLLVPFCGDYAEAHAWSPEEKEFYERFLAKREAMAELERQSIQRFLQAQENQAAAGRRSEELEAN